MTTLDTFSKKHIPHINHVMSEYIDNTCQDVTLKESMEYSIAAGGKRFRPLLLLATANFCDCDITTNLYKVAAALEMIHTYSLIHDDLPAMDDDDLRRGKATNHKIYGDAIAILAGDALLTDAFGLVSQTTLNPEVKLTLIQQLSYAAGSHGMVAGQAADIKAEDKTISLKELQFVHARKTGALIEYAVTSGAKISNVSETVQTQLKSYSHHLGIAFQIKDDLLDVIGEEAELGKKIGMDLEHHKSTYPSLLGVDGSKKALEEQCFKAKSALNSAKSLLLKEVTEVTLLDKFIQSLELTK